MKKFISVIIMTLFTGLNFLFAQQTNQVILEGDLSFTSTSFGYANSDDKVKTSTYKFSPSIGIILC
ncbi:hypothetical protein [Flammeovirga sp. SJP92]|uniref:hypothetical protein n=1 Tax=Flammeovirga sp. SJP92 TaxID=1775430 RepID=UPI000786A0A8|nr:hypothetical protein [Flammeovirga sp. SJP92]KXX72375.1 hypothetical protein AVL50_01880 [Flammeovirga sp. SJP92]